jgi:hypothetical protein
MRFRKLRIAWSIAWVLICVPLVVLWALSYSEEDHWDLQLGNSRIFWVGTILGRIVVAPKVRQITSDETWTTIQPGERLDWSHDAPVWSFGDGSYWSAPLWFPVLLASTFAVAPWIPWSTRFALRTILILTTLVAVVLGLIAWSIR